MNSCNKFLAMMSVAVFATGCTTFHGTHKMSLQDLGRFQIDCANKDAQIRFLESQRPTANDKFQASFGKSWIEEVIARNEGRKTVHTAILDGDYTALVNHHIWTLRTHCPMSDYERHLTKSPTMHNLRTQ